MGSDKSKIDIPPLKGRKGIGIALGSGLARGFTHIGVLKTLNKHGIYPGIVAGTSMGALVGGSYLAGKLDELEDWALSLNRFQIFKLMDLKVRSPGLIGGDKLERIMKEHLGGINIEDLPHPFIAIGADLTTGHEIWMREGNLIDALQASYALPGVFAPVKRNHRYLVDGALVNPVPVSVCQAFGARLNIAVDLHGDLIGKSVKPGNKYQTVAGFDVFDDNEVPKEEQKAFKRSGFARRLFRRDREDPSLFGVMVSSLGIIQDRLTRSRLAGDPPDVHIKPPIGHVGMLEFERAKDLIEIGERAAEEMIPDIKIAMEVLLPPLKRDEKLEDIPLNPEINK